MAYERALDVLDFLISAVENGAFKKRSGLTRCILLFETCRRENLGKQTTEYHGSIALNIRFNNR